MKIQLPTFTTWRHPYDSTEAAIRHMLDVLHVRVTRLVVMPLTFGGDRVELDVDLEGRTSQIFWDELQALTGSIGFNVHIHVEVPDAQSPPTQTIPRGTNQQVFNALALLLALIPTDLANQMAAHRHEVYSGPAVEAWGLGDVDRAAIMAALRAAGLV